MAEQEVMFIVRGRLLDPNGVDLGPAPKAQPDTDSQPTPDDRTVEELRDALEAAEVKIPSGSKRADLLKLAEHHGV